MAQLKNTTISDTGSLNLPAGTTAQRPASPAAGQIRYNTTINDTEYYDGAAWRPISDSNPEATGGTIVDTDTGGVPYRIHLFTNTGNSTFTVTRGGEVEYLVVAGGGGGGAGWNGGGGGAGGVLTGVTAVTQQAYTVVVGTSGINGRGNGAGDGRVPTNGGNSSAFGITATGGGSGGQELPNKVAQDGGSGGGGVHGQSSSGGTVQPGGGISGQGNSGGAGVSSSPDFVGGGGGGAGSAGVNATSSKAGNGGQGILSQITGNSVFYAGGGGGSHRRESTNGLGGLGGGGFGGAPTPGTDATPNTGGGGGAGATTASGSNDGVGGGGGSGIVIVRYRRNISTQTNPDATLVSSLPLSKPAPSSQIEPGRHYYNMLTINTGPVHYVLTTPFDIDTRTEVSRFSPGVRSDNMAISNDGKKLWICASGDVLYYELSTPFNLSTQTLITTFSNFHPANEVTCFQFADQGRKFYDHQGSGGEIIQYDLVIPYDLTTRTESGRLGGFPTVWGPGDPAFSPDGTRVAIGRRQGTLIVGGVCTRPFDISTFAEEGTVTSTDGDPSCCKWNGDGTRLYVRHASPDMVNEWTTTTPYSVVGMTYTREVTPSTSFTAGGLDFNYNH